MRGRGRRTAGRLLAAVFIITAVFAAGCGKDKDGGTKVVLTTGFSKDEVFRIENISCTLPEIMVYLTNMQDQYESVFGKEIWEASFDGVTLEQNVKDITLARIAQVKTMNLLAREHEVELDDKEKEKVGQAAEKYYGSLSGEEAELLGVEKETIEKLYAEYALANKVYDFIIKDINPEISDDEARTITVQQILIKTYTLDGSGQKVEFGQAMKEDAYRKALDILREARDGADFEELMKEYSEDDKETYSFGKGEMDKVFEDAAFNLGNDEISGVVETEYGYHIIKCISTFNREETDANKIKIVEQRKKEVFGQEYDAFVASLTRELNKELWNSVTFLDSPLVNTVDFFDVYGEFFG